MAEALCPAFSASSGLRSSLGVIGSSPSKKWAQKASVIPNIAITCAKQKASKPKGGASGSRSSGASGFGAKPVKKAPSADAASLLRRSEEMYGLLLSNFGEDGEVREFVVCARQKPEPGASSMLSDWAPVAELALVSHMEAVEAMELVLPLLCREVAECASKSHVALRGIARNRLEYAYETLDSFYTHVMAGTSISPTDTEDCPFQTLGVPRNSSAAEIRTAYRALAAAHHPDRHVGGNQAAAEERYKKVMKAYDQIKRSGSLHTDANGGGSYENLGGASRSGLSDPINLSNVRKDGEMPPNTEAAVRPIDPEIVSRFIASMNLRERRASAAASKATVTKEARKDGTRERATTGVS